ncbi:MAG: hypothetical protein IRZ24_09085, partial [Thermogemmatispora sp.]
MSDYSFKESSHSFQFERAEIKAAPSRGRYPTYPPPYQDEPMPRSEQANQQIRDERRRQILHVAAEIFARRGLAETR